MRALVAINGAQLFGSIASSAISGARSLLSYADSQSRVIDASSKMAARLGMTYGEFAGLSLAADLAGVSMETIGKASQRAEIAFAKAAGGSKIATAAFSGLGLSVQELGGMSASERFDAIAAAIAKIPSEGKEPRRPWTFSARPGPSCCRCSPEASTGSPRPGRKPSVSGSL